MLTCDYFVGVFPFAAVLIVQRICELIVGNCAFDDTSMKFGTQLEVALRKIFGYRAIADFAYGKMAAIFQNGRHTMLFYR